MTNPTPTPPAINGASLLNEVEAFHRRFNVFPREAAYVAVTLWDAHAHLVDCFDTTPRIAFLSPEPGSGKSRALEIIETLTPRAMTTVNGTANALFRLVEATEGRPTLLFDEIDTVFGPKAGDNEPVRGFLNSGYRRSGKALRCVGESQTPQFFSAFCAVAMAGLGSLPDTILTRAVIIRMRKRAPNEKVEPYRERINEREGHALRDRLGKWAATVRDQVAGAWPVMPDGVADRSADVWEPLLAIADAAGGEWPERARAACIELVITANAHDKASQGVQLLTDLRDKVFCGSERMPTAAILELLHQVDDAPWSDMDGNGKLLNPRTLSKLLGEYVTGNNEPIRPRSIRTARGVPKGYYAEDLADAWLRYCPPPPESAATTATAATPQVNEGESVAEELPGIRYITPEAATADRTA